MVSSAGGGKAAWVMGFAMRAQPGRRSEPRTNFHGYAPGAAITAGGGRPPHSAALAISVAVPAADRRLKSA